MDFNFNQINFLTSLSDLPEKEKKEHTATALTLLGEQKTNEEKELLSGLKEENQKSLEEKSSLIVSKRHPQLPVFSSSVKLESQPGRGRFLVAATNICPGKRIFCIFVFVFLFLYFCICIFVFILLYLYFCVRTFVFVFSIWFLVAATNICPGEWICLLLSGAFLISMRQCVAMQV